MKQLMIVFLATSSLFFNSDQGLDGITKAMKSGDATALSQYFDSDIELTILNDIDILNKQSAKQEIASFFKKNAPSGYAQLHQGTSKGQRGQYSIGNLTTSNGKFRVYIYMKVEGGKYLIQELRFEE
ncbi:MAG: DUF4783 domain-containing protein [Saprospiraceae bacterium]